MTMTSDVHAATCHTTSPCVLRCKNAHAPSILFHRSCSMQPPVCWEHDLGALTRLTSASVSLALGNASAPSATHRSQPRGMSPGFSPRAEGLPSRCGCCDGARGLAGGCAAVVRGLRSPWLVGSG
jgi:hypothetical protein